MKKEKPYKAMTFTLPADAEKEIKEFFKSYRLETFSSFARNVILKRIRQVKKGDNFNNTNQ